MSHALRIADVVDMLTVGTFPLRFTAYDGSATGPLGAPIRVHLARERGLRYVACAPGSLGLARAYLAGDLRVAGVHPGDPYPVFAAVAAAGGLRRPTAAEALRIVAAFGPGILRAPAPPPVEAPSRWRSALTGRRPAPADAVALAHRQDVSEEFYAHLLGPSMTYTCACYATPEQDLTAAQEAKHDLVLRRLGLEPGMRLLDVGCGWGGMVMHAAARGVRALGVTLSRSQALWANRAIAAAGLNHRARVVRQDYRTLRASGFDALCAIGLSEQVGPAGYGQYFAFLRSRLREGGRLLNQGVTRPDEHSPVHPRGFAERYVFPGGRLGSLGRVVGGMQEAGLEVRHEENLREHYALTLRDWSANLTEHWDACRAEAGPTLARVWGLHLAGSRLAFERGELEVHQVLAVRTGPDGAAHQPLRPGW